MVDVDVEEGRCLKKWRHQGTTSTFPKIKFLNKVGIGVCVQTGGQKEGRGIKEIIMPRLFFVLCPCVHLVERLEEVRRINRCLEACHYSINYSFLGALQYGTEG